MKKILIVTAVYYPEISANLKSGATNFLKANNHEIKIIDVPGIFEIPSVVSKYIDKFDGVVVLGCVIKGETSHFELISRSVTESIMNLSISYKKPIGNGLISCLNKKQALERSDLQNESKNKGVEAAKAVSLILNSEPVDFKSS